MHILHILGRESTVGTEAGFLDMVGCFARAGFARGNAGEDAIEKSTLEGGVIEQRVVMPPGRRLEAALERARVPCKKAKFSGLFDLRTQRTIADIDTDFSPDICLAHTPDAHKSWPRAIALQKILLEKHAPPPLTWLEDKAVPLAPEDVQTPKDAFIIGTLAHIARGRGIDKLIRALREIPGVHLWIGGEGPDLERLQQIALKTGFSDRIHFTGRQTNRAAFLKALDVCFVPQRDRGIDRLTLEAWAAGTAVLSALTQQAQTPARDKKTALFLPQDLGVPGWRALIRELIGDELLRTRLKKEGLAAYQDSYCPDAVLPAYQSFFRMQIAANRPQPPAL